MYSMVFNSPNKGVMDIFSVAPLLIVQDQHAHQNRILNIKNLQGNFSLILMNWSPKLKNT